MQKNNAIILVCVLFSILFFFGRQDHRVFYANIIGKTAFYPLINSIREAQAVFQARSENRDLTEKVASQQFRIAQLENQIQTNLNTEISLSSGVTGQMNFTIAEVIGFSGTFKERNIVADHGTLHGIKAGFPVIHRDGIVGKIISTTLNTSAILPLNHSRFKCAILDKRSRVQGMLENDLNGKTYMNLIPTGASIAIGDTIITSNISTIFPKGINVGTIKQIIRVPGETFVKAEIESFVRISDLEQVVVLLNYNESKENEDNNEN